MTTRTADAAQPTIRRARDEERQQPGATLPILHAIQDDPGPSVATVSGHTIPAR